MQIWWAKYRIEGYLPGTANKIVKIIAMGLKMLRKNKTIFEWQFYEVSFYIYFNKFLYDIAIISEYC